MARLNREVILLVAEDDDEDFYLIQEALREANLPNPVIRAKNGIELMECLKNYSYALDTDKLPSSIVVLLDLNMPQKDGREILKEIKTNVKFSQIPASGNLINSANCPI